MTLSEIATAALPLLERLKPAPLDAPLEVVHGLMQLQDDLTKAKQDELANRVIVIILAVAPVPDHDKRPPKMDVFASYMVEQLVADLRKFLE